MNSLRIFIGVDVRHILQYTVLHTSIMARTGSPIAITPLLDYQLPVKRRGLTSFTWTRFLVPWLCDYKGWAVFMDSDMMALADIQKLFDLRDESKAVMVCQNRLKFEWGSMMLFNCGHPDNKVLTPEYIETAEGLHGCQWTDNVGSLPLEWNHLVGYDEPQDAKLVHFTQGVPCYPETKESEYSAEWNAEAKAAMTAVSWQEIMGQSVHAKPVYERLSGGPVECPSCKEPLEKIEHFDGGRKAHYQCGHVAVNGEMAA